MFPQATIEPVRDKLAQRFMGETAGRENIWPEHMRQQMLSTQVELCVLLGEIGLTLEQVQALEIGQNLSFHTEPAELMDVQCGGLKLARVRAGQRRGNLAVSLATPVSRERMP